MMSDWEDKFMAWAKAPSETERTKCSNAETAIRKAIAADPTLSKLDITVFPQGSYRNRTNIRQDSDVDICARLNSTIFAEYPAGKADSDFGNSAGSIKFSDYKNLIQKALEDFFGADAVTRGNKAFDVHANTYRIDADVVPTFEHRRYPGGKSANGSHEYLSGIAFNTDAGVHIINWPEQNYDNGVAKHDSTGRRFKKVIRILKRLRKQMQEEKIAAADGIASCLIEALAWNAPDENFGNGLYRDDVRAVLAHTFNKTMTDKLCSEWGEVNELKYLFRSAQPWTRSQAHGFLSAAWDYLGFE
jgi:hypothetical protein